MPLRLRFSNPRRVRYATSRYISRLYYLRNFVSLPYASAGVIPFPTKKTHRMPGLPCSRVRVCVRASARVGVAACVVCSVLVLGNMGIPWCCKYEWQFAASGCVGVPRPSAMCVSYVGLRLRSVSHGAVCTCTYYACVLISKHSVHKLTMCPLSFNSHQPVCTKLTRTPPPPAFVGGPKVVLST
jgi:hypothetical protein